MAISPLIVTRDVYYRGWENACIVGLRKEVPDLPIVGYQHTVVTQAAAGMFLGLNGIAVKSHGATDVLGFANAISFAYDMAREGYNDMVVAELNRWHEDRRGGEARAAVV